AFTYRDAGQLAKALPLFELAVEKMKSRLGPDHPDTLTSMGNLALAYLDTGKAKRALPLFNQLPSVHRKQFGGNDPRLSGQLAARLPGSRLPSLKSGGHAHAGPPRRDALAIRVRAQPDAWSTLNTKAMRGGSLRGKKKHGDAEPLLKEGYEGMKQREKTIPPL